MTAIFIILFVLYILIAGYAFSGAVEMWRLGYRRLAALLVLAGVAAFGLAMLEAWAA